MQEEEKKTTEQLRMIIDFVHDGVITTDERGVVTVISPVAEKIFGVKKRDVVGKPVEAIRRPRLQTIVKPLDGAAATEAVAVALRSRRHE